MGNEAFNMAAEELMNFVGGLPSDLTACEVLERLKNAGLVGGALGGLGGGAAKGLSEVDWRQLLSRFRHSDEAIEALNAARTIAPAKRASGSTVLGHYPEYANMADTLGHRRFDIPTAVWDKMTDAQRWTANQKFLDRTISRGDDILLSTPLDKVKPGSYFERELQYLSGKGYTPSADGTRLIPGGN
jgi:hypothetical protein